MKYIAHSDSQLKAIIEAITAKDRGAMVTLYDTDRFPTYVESNIKLKPFKVVVAGGRDFTNKTLLFSTLDNLLQYRPHVIIISGEAEGADKLGEEYAAERGYEVERYPADWKTHGKAAGPIRNRQMGKVANAVVAFWDGKSKGTADMRRVAIEMNLPLRTIKY